MIRNKARISTLASLIQHTFGSFSHSNQRRRRNKRNLNWKRSKTVTVCNETILHIENPKDTLRKVLELINEFGQEARHKINAQKSLAFLYTNDEKSEREIKETLPLTIATKRIKYLGINLPKETKDLYAENYKTLMNEIVQEEHEECTEQ